MKLPKVVTSVAVPTKKDYHFINVNFGRDFDGEVGKFRLTEAGETCPHCGGTLQKRAALRWDKSSN